MRCFRPKEELEKLTGQPLAAASQSGTPGKDSEALFVARTWQNPTGTIFTFKENGECTWENGSEHNEGVWRRKGLIVEVTGGMPLVTRYFRFISLQEAYIGNSREDIKIPLALK